MSTHTARYTVTGMTCEHCVASVTEEVAEVDGVTDVRVDLVTGALNVAGDRPVAGRRRARGRRGGGLP